MTVFKSLYYNKITATAKIALVISLGYFMMGKIYLSSYLIFDSNFWIGLLLLPYLALIESLHKGGLRFLAVALVFIGLSWFTGVYSFYYLAIGFALIFMVENLVGRLNEAPVFLLVVISPAFNYVNNFFGFPLRLKLSEIAGNTLHWFGYKTEVLGNVIIMNGTEFSVDPACVGLKMMAISILASLVLMAYFQRETAKSLGFIRCMMVIACTITLNIICNLLRIILLVIFTILPGNRWHDFVGILCLILYVITPIYFIIKYLYRIRKAKEATGKERSFPLWGILLCHLSLLAVIYVTGEMKMKKSTKGTIGLPTIASAGYTRTIVNQEILKLEKPGLLIYIKPLMRFYGAEHNPMICWVGSGYEFKFVNKQIIAGKEIYSGNLTKGNDNLYSAWWFDNGTYQTIDQLDWRWRALKGEEFYLINISSPDKNLLMNEITSLLTTKNYFAIKPQGANL